MADHTASSHSQISSREELYDAAIVGGGLAGLALSIRLAQKGHKVILFEKEQYPFHKVCGEYISRESWDFLCSLGLELEKMNVSLISKLQVSAVNGKMLQHELPLGGFGISRYKLDAALAAIAIQSGVLIKVNTKVNEISFTGNQFSIETTAGTYRSVAACGSFGKRSNIDIKWKRPFSNAPKNKLNNFIGIKYHINTSFPADTVALHNFSNGYCGIVKIEDDKYCLCYLTTAANLQQSGNDIKKMEAQILSQNPLLKKIFEESNMLYDHPLSISQISFDKKSQVENHVLMAGDAAGMITPLCGNGMSMALHGAKLASDQVHLFLAGKISRDEMESIYQQLWRKQFSKRLKTGRIIQSLFGSRRLSNLVVTMARPFPWVLNYLVKQTHGKSIPVS